MSRTRHHGARRLKGLNPTERARVYQWWRKESPDYRAIYQRIYRQRVRQAMHRGDYEGVPRWRPTRGWLTS